MSGLLQAWSRTAKADGGATALVDAADGRTWTRRDLDDLASTWAAEHGHLVRGRVVLFAEPNGAGWLRVFLGLVKSGAIAASIEPGEPPDARERIVRGIRASFLWSGGRLAPAGAAGRPCRDDRRVLKLTSGSTGAPKGVAFTDSQLLADARQVCAAMRLRRTDVNFGLIPFGHSYGLGNIVLPLISRGMAVVCGTAALPHAVASEIERWRPSVLPSVPALLRAMSEADIPALKLRSLRTVISAGAPLSPETAQAFRARYGLRIHNFYGSSETGGIAYDGTGDAALLGRGVGRPLGGVRLSFGTGNRFTVESAAVYTLGNPSVPGPGGRGRHRPADLGRLDDGGGLVLIGRSGRMLKIGARRLDPAEVERALRRIPGVRDALVARHPKRPDALAALVGGSLSAEDMRRELRGALAQWKIPKRLVVVPEFPLTPRGKPDRVRIQALLGGSA